MDIRALGVARASADLGIGTTNTASRPMFSGNDSYSLGSGMKDSYGQLTDSLEYMGCNIIKTNHGSDNLRDTSGGTTLGEAKYNLDWLMGMTDSTTETTGVRAVMFTPESVGAIRLQGLKVDVVDDIRRNTTFTVASMMNGTGVLRPECAALIHAGNGDHADNDTRAELRGASKIDVDADGYVEA